MTDLEMTKACAQEMGYEVVQRSARKKDGWWCIDLVSNYDPLHDDAQAMALVKRFRLQIDAYDDQWNVACVDKSAAIREDLNRAIVECIAKLKSA